MQLLTVPGASRFLGRHVPRRRREDDAPQPLELAHAELEPEREHQEDHADLAEDIPPRDVTLQELCVELFYPADAASEALLRGTRPDLPTTIGTLPPTRPGAPP